MSTSIRYSFDVFAGAMTFTDFSYVLPPSTFTVALSVPERVSSESFDTVAVMTTFPNPVTRKLPRGHPPRLSRGLLFYAVVAGGTYSPLTFNVPRFKRTSTGAPPSAAFCRRRRYRKPMFFAAL